ncbi:hypothetical protein HYX13_05720 [Candidatus Woesearchaeota archaeon]|nr:hypothetical protein [Candidatus Woesearchaeota archaeon]
MDVKALLNAGLTKGEVRVYITLLERGSCLTGEISRHSGIHRRTIYDFLERLIQKGLVVYIKKNSRRYYGCVHPKRFLELAREQEDNLQALMPELLLKYEEGEVSGETVFYRGTLGIKTIFEDQLSVAQPVYVISASPKMREELKHYLPHYTRERIRKKIKLFLLYDEQFRDEIEKREQDSFVERRYLPKGFGSSASTNIYGDTVAIILWQPEPVAIVIKQKDIAEGYRKMFGLLLKQSESNEKIKTKFSLV